MDSETINKFKQQLIQLYDDILAMNESAKESAQPVELDQTRVGRLSRMDAMQGQQMAKESERRRQQHLLMIKAALKRIDEGNFGYCMVCDEEIDIRRLQLDPSIPNCITCAK